MLKTKVDFENIVVEDEKLWIKNGGATDKEREEYLAALKESCGMEKLQNIYQEAYDRYQSE